MDLHGIRESLVIEPADRPGFLFDEIIKSLPFPMRVRKSYYIRKNLEFTYPLPKRIDKTFQGRTGLLAYDLVVISGVDIQEFTPQEQLNLISYVEHGGALLFTGGAYALDKSDGTFELFGKVLPVEITYPQEPKITYPDFMLEAQKKSFPVRLSRNHVITRTLPENLGYVNVVQPVTVKTWGKVVARAGDKPLVVAGEQSTGRVAVIATYPERDLFKGVIDMETFFEHSAYDDFMRNLVMWLVGKEKEIIIRSFSVTQEKNRRWEIRADVCPSKEKIRRAVIEVTANDPVRAALGREPEFSAPVVKQEIQLKGEKIREFFTVPDMPEYGPSTLLKVALTVQYGKDIDRDYKEIRRDPYEPVAYRRDEIIEIKNTKYITIKNLEDEYVFVPGWTVNFEISMSDIPAALDIALYDDIDNSFLEQKLAPKSKNTRISITLPDLRGGRYVLQARAMLGNKEVKARYPFAVVRVEPVEDLLFVGPVGVAGLNERRIREDVEDRVKKGFNCLIAQPVRKHASERFYRNVLYYRYLAQFEHRTYLWGEYEGLTVIVDHGPWFLHEGENPNRPCIFDPQFAVKQENYIRPVMERAEKIPALLSMEILDEPHTYPSNVCRCKLCLKRFKEKYGYEMPRWMELVDVKDRRRYDFFDFIGDYYKEGFRITYQTLLKHRKRIQVNHVFALVGAGQYSTHNSFADDLKWFPYCDTFEFDCYNYMYAHFAAAEYVKFHQFHFAFARYRDLSRYYGNKELHFFVQTDDRDYPHDIEPLNAPVEILYTAIGQGAKVFHLMYKPTFSNVFGLREERWALFGKELVKIRKASPLLAKLEKQASPLAMMFPHTNCVLNPRPKELPEGYVGIGFYHKEERPFNRWYPSGYTPFNSYEFLFRYFGECDVIEERLVAEGRLAMHRALALLATTYIHADAVRNIRQFIENGGILICDRIPEFDHTGRRIDFLPQLAWTEESIFGNVKLKSAKMGRGSVYLLSTDLDDLYTDILLSEDARRDRILSEKFQEIMFVRERILPAVLSTNPQVEASILENDQFIAVVAINHGSTQQTTTVKVFRPGYDVQKAVDLITFEQFQIRETPDGFEFEITLSDRSGRFIGLYSAPAENIVAKGSRKWKPGDEPDMTIIPVRDGKSAQGEYLVNLTCKNPRGETAWSKIASINGTGYRVCSKIPANEISGKWVLDAELLLNGHSLRWEWEVG